MAFQIWLNRALGFRRTVLVFCDSSVDVRIIALLRVVRFNFSDSLARFRTMKKSCKSNAKPLATDLNLATSPGRPGKVGLWPLGRHA